MARNGYQIFDADTHVGPAAEILAQYLTAQEQARLTSWEPYKAVQRRTGHVTYTRYPHGKSWFPQSVETVLGRGSAGDRQAQVVLGQHRQVLRPLLLGRHGAGRRRRAPSRMARHRAALYISAPLFPCPWLIVSPEGGMTALSQVSLAQCLVVCRRPK